MRYAWLKHEKQWPESFRHREQAAALDATDEGAWWNLGIAATALGDWTTARRAWRSCGIAIPEGEGPVHMDMGPVPVRLDPKGLAEVVWCDRIDPARAIIMNVPLPESGRR